MHRIARQIYSTILQANHVLLVPHKHPDGDALGAVAAFMQFLRRMEVAHTAFCATDISPQLTFLPHIRYITKDEDVVRSSDVDVVVCFDAGDLRYPGIDTLLADRDTMPTIINFDHHDQNEFFGDYNMVMTDASSTTEVLHRFFQYNNVSIDQDIATCLLTGLMYDTDSFTNAATSHSSLSVAGELIARGGDLDTIRKHMFRNKSIKTLKIWGNVLARLCKHEELDLVHTYITKDDLQRYGMSEEATTGFANFLNILGDGSAVMILIERDTDVIKGSFRTTHDHIDVGVWAKRLGGGGHQKAAGFTVNKPMDEALSHILDTIKNHSTSLQ